MLCMVRHMPAVSRFAIFAPPPSEIPSPGGFASVRERLAEFDGFAVVYPGDARDWGESARVISWSRLVRTPGAARVLRRSEQVVVVSPRPRLFKVSPELYTKTGLYPLSARRPPEWERWVLAHLGARPGVDAVHDLDHGERMPAFDDQLPLFGADSEDEAHDG